VTEIEKDAAHIAERIDATYDALVERGYTQTFAKDVIAGLASGGYFTTTPIVTEVHQR